MAEIDFVPGLITLALGVGLGLLLALTGRRGPAERPQGGAGATPSAARREDLAAEKERLLEALRDLQDTAAQNASSAEERAGLERQAARVFRAIAQTEASQPAAESGSPQSPAEGRGLQWLLASVAVIGFTAAVTVALSRGTTERVGDMGMTGGMPIVSSNEVSATVPEPGSTGGAVEGVPASLQPRPSPRVDAARARVATDPGTIDHWSELGYALIEAQGWIDAYTVSEEMLARFPGHPDGHVIQAVVRIAMGMEQEAVRLLELARAAAPNHVPALSYSGMLAVRRGDTDAARIFWAQAMQASPLEQRAEFAELLAMLDRPGGFGAPAGAEGGPAHPPAGGPAHPPAGTPAAAGSEAGVEGTLRLADGAVVPAGGTLFLIARRPGVERGPPVATRKMLGGRFPTPFTLGSGDVMMGGAFPDQVSLSARLDADGDPMTQGPQDLIGSAGVVSSGDQGVEIVLAPRAD